VRPGCDLEVAQRTVRDPRAAGNACKSADPAELVDPLIIRDSAQTTRSADIAGIFKPSDGLDSSTPSLTMEVLGKVNSPLPHRAVQFYSRFCSKNIDPISSHQSSAMLLRSRVSLYHSFYRNWSGLSRQKAAGGGRFQVQATRPGRLRHA
jgi:hypothetical protein